MQFSLTGTLTPGNTILEFSKNLRSGRNKVRINGRLDISEATNVWIGENAGINNSRGLYNTAIGINTLQQNTIGRFNTAIGFKALSENTDGYSNTAIGFESLIRNTNGIKNVALGSRTLYKNTIGQHNTMIGHYSGQSNEEGNRNTFIGSQTGRGNIDGSCNVLIGESANVSGPSTEYEIAIGCGAVGKGSYTATIGTALMEDIGGAITWTSTSDGRFKSIIDETVPGIKFIEKLTPRMYHFEARKMDNFINGSQTKRFSKEALKAYEKKESIKYTGFVAQEVEEIANALGYDFSGVVKPQKENGIYGLRYAEFVVPLVKATQEQQVIITTLQTENEELRDILEQQQEDINALKELVNQLATTSEQAGQNKILTISPKATLAQNQPNPFSQTTEIPYFIPNHVKTACLQITGMDGKIIARMDKLQKGKGTVTIDASKYQNGIFNYSLILDGKVEMTKKMMFKR